MTSTQYNAKKLRPFRLQRDALINDLKKLEQDYLDEEKLNDQYFDDLNKAEKEYDILVKLLEQQLKHNNERSNGTVTQESQGVDEQLETYVTKTLRSFLLNESKKEILESIQQAELAKRDEQLQQFKQIILNKKQDEEIQKNQEEEQEDGYYITLKYQNNSVDVKVPGSIKTFRDLKSIVKSCFMAEDNEIFYSDLLGNILQFEMNVLNELYPPIYELLKNYQPILVIQIIRQKKQKDERNNTSIFEEVLFTEAFPDGLTKTIRATTKRLKKQVNWSLYLGYLNKAKYFFESCLFTLLLVLFVATQIDTTKFTTSTQALSSFQNNFQLTRSYLDPIQNISTIINQTLADENETSEFFTHSLKSGLLIQSLVNEEELNDCDILNQKQLNLFKNQNQSCLNFNSLVIDDLNEQFTQTLNFNPAIYNDYFGGFVWELNLNSIQSFTKDIEKIHSENWLKYNSKKTQFILNYYNSPTNRLIQVTITTLYLFHDELLNYNSISTVAFDKTKQNDSEELFQDVMFYVAILLLIPSFFDFFGFYFQGTQNPLVLTHIRYNDLLNRRKRMQAKKRELTPQEEREFQQKKLILNDFFIIDLKVIYMAVKIPLIFDIVYMLSNVSILIRTQITKAYLSELNKIMIGADTFQDLSKLETPLFTVRLYDGIQMLFLMLAINRFLGNWSPYLKCYGLVMIRFNKESWFLLLVLVFIISICAMAWCITLQGRLINHDNFFYAFLGLLRCTLKYGMHNDIAEQGLYHTYVKDISFSFETRYIQYVIIMVVTMIMIPIFISLMTQQVHNTKEEAKQKMMEYNK